jgi:hypothetical protein
LFIGSLALEEWKRNKGKNIFVARPDTNLLSDTPFSLSIQVPNLFEFFFFETMGPASLILENIFFGWLMLKTTWCQ